MNFLIQHPTLINNVAINFMSVANNIDSLLKDKETSHIVVSEVLQDNISANWCVATPNFNVLTPIGATIAKSTAIIIEKVTAGSVDLFGSNVAVNSTNMIHGLSSKNITKEHVPVPLSISDRINIERVMTLSSKNPHSGSSIVMPELSATTIAQSIRQSRLFLRKDIS